MAGLSLFLDEVGLRRPEDHTRSGMRREAAAKEAAISLYNSPLARPEMSG